MKETWERVAEEMEEKKREKLREKERNVVVIYA